MSRTPVVRALLLASIAVAPPAGAQTMLDQQQRLIDIHDLLLDLPPVEAPGVLAPFQLAVSAEVITIPSIDGATGTRRQITASDHTPLFPRPRIALGLPAPEGFRAFAGVSYIPPVTLADVNTHYVAAEAGIAHDVGPLAVGLRAHVVHAFSKSPVTDPTTRDTLETLLYGADLGAAHAFDLGVASLTPYAGLGVRRMNGRFRVTSDGVVLKSDVTRLAVQGGLRLLVKGHWEAVGELDAYPGRLVHPNFRVGYLFDLR
jgi:hypothetical protein